MNYFETITLDLVKSMKQKDFFTLEVLRGIKTALINELIATGGKPTDIPSDQISLTILKRLAKQRKDSADQFLAGHRSDLAEKELKELAIINTYLPSMMSEEQIRGIAQEVIASIGSIDASKKGMIVGMVMKQTSGQADGTLVKSVVEELL